MLAKVKSGALMGIDASPVEVEVNSGEGGEPRIFMVGLPDAAVKESADRVSAALSNSGFSMPMTKMTINLAPGDIRKEGPIYDLPISLGILASVGVLDPSLFEDFLIAGELSLSGDLRPIRGGVSLALRAREDGIKNVILPPVSASEAALVEGVDVFAPRSLSEVVSFFRGNSKLAPIDFPKEKFSGGDYSGADFSEVKGQQHVKRAIEVAVAGGHNLLMIGPPGSGKSMMAKRIPSIMPPPSLREYLEILGIYSASGIPAPESNGTFRRPFRSPHHTISDVALTGGGAFPKPGEISLAHNGVLFLDELPEFSRKSLEVMRQPLEDGIVGISRSSAKVEIPCRFMLVAAMNPCPCGFLGDPRRKCHCSPSQIQKYRSRISGPLLDRIDIHVEASALPLSELGRSGLSESSGRIRERVCLAREIQRRRFESSEMASKTNSAMTSKQVREFCPLTSKQSEILSVAMDELCLSARAWDRIIKVARTIADLAGCENIETDHLMEAINYRNLDRRR